jgi:hypothetical protein
MTYFWVLTTIFNQGDKCSPFELDLVEFLEMHAILSRYGEH